MLVLLVLVHISKSTQKYWLPHLSQCLRSVESISPTNVGSFHSQWVNFFQTFLTDYFEKTRVSHRSSATRWFRMLVHGDYETYHLEFCTVTTLDPQRPAHLSFEEFHQGLCVWQAIKCLSESHVSLAKSIYFRTAALKSWKMHEIPYNLVNR